MFFPIVFVALVAALAGCQSARVAQPLTAGLAGNAPGQQMEFFHTLATRPVTSNDEAFHGVLLFSEGQDPAADYAGRVAALKSRKMLPAGFDEPSDRAVERGTLAVALVRALSVKGGVVMRVLGPTPRYAVRELQFIEVFPPSSPNQTFSGSEFLSVLSKAEEYQRTAGRPQREPEAQKTLPPPPPPEPAPAPQQPPGV